MNADSRPVPRAPLQANADPEFYRTHLRSILDSHVADQHLDVGDFVQQINFVQEEAAAGRALHPEIYVEEVRRFFNLRYPTSRSKNQPPSSATSPSGPSKGA